MNQSVQDYLNENAAYQNYEQFIQQQKSVYSSEQLGGAEDLLLSAPYLKETADKLKEVFSKGKELYNSVSNKIDQLLSKYGDKVDLKDLSINKLKNMSLDDIKQLGADGLEGLKKGAMNKLDDLTGKGLSKLSGLKEQGMSKLQDIKSMGESLKEQGINKIEDFKNGLEPIKSNAIDNLSDLQYKGFETIGEYQSGLNQAIKNIGNSFSDVEDIQKYNTLKSDVLDKLQTRPKTQLDTSNSSSLFKDSNMNSNKMFENAWNEDPENLRSLPFNVVEKTDILKGVGSEAVNTSKNIGENIGENIGKSIESELPEISLNDILGPVSVVGDLAIAGVSIYEGIKSLFDRPHLYSYSKPEFTAGI